MVRYSEERKEAVLRKLLPPHNCAIRELAKEEGISEVTLYNWRRQAQGQSLVVGTEAGPEGWSSAEKFAAVLESATLNEADLTEYCRQRGLSTQHVKSWRAACEQANDWKNGCALQAKTELENACQRIRELERELRLKDKVLAEMAALLVLKKSGDAIRGKGEDP
ncbi:MAG: transposase [Gammaproteobacteria bacterium]